MKKLSLLFFALVISATALFAQSNYNEDGIQLFHTPSQEELDWAKSKGYDTIRITPTSSPIGQIRPIAEWEPAEAVLIRYPLGFPVSFVQKLAEYIKVITVVSQSNLASAKSEYTSGGVNMSNCEFLIASNNSYWVRDYGPWFMAIDNSRVSMFDFTYNRPRPQDNLVNGLLANHLSLVNNHTYFVSPLELTGGNYMNDGIKQAASSTVTLVENSGWGNEQQIKAHFNEYLGIEQYHFREDPVSTASSYLQHIDCWAKFLGPDKVLVDSVAAGSYFAKFEAVANYFRSQISSYGTPYKVYRVYAPGASGSSPLTPYSNSLILNNKVFVPVGGNSYDAAALQVYEKAMPGYTIVPVSNNLPYPDYWLNTDALHCRTHEIADRGMLYVKHQPKFGEIANTGTINFSTELYSYGNNTIYSDSVIVYLRVNNGCYHAYHMENVGNNTWEVNISGLPGGLVEYYIYAADVSGRRESHPYIARYAPDKGAHKFTLTGAVTALPALALDKTNSSVTSEGFNVIKDFITLSNPGFANLSFEITNIDFHEMLTIAPLNGTIQPCGSQAITLSYDFSNVPNGTYLGSFTLISNDPKNPATEIALFAKQNILPPAPVLSLSKTSSSVYLEAYTKIEDFITVSNLGSENLMIEITDIDFGDMFSIDPHTGTIPKGDSLILTLSYNFNIIAKAEEFFGSFKLNSNDPLKPEVEISLHASLNVGINETNLSEINIYPNPTTGQLKIENGELKINNVEIFDVYGRKIHALTPSLLHPFTTINISHLNSGIYFVKITTDSGQSVVRKILKL